MGLTDASGNTLNTYTYDMWANPLTTSETVAQPFRYSGEMTDNTTGLQYLRARWYDPSMGRFVNEDSNEGQINNPLSLNLYTYVENNPLTRIDPSGHSWCTFILCGPENAAQNYQDAKKLYEQCDFCQAAMDYAGPEIGVTVGAIAIAKKSPGFFKKIWNGVKGVFSKTSKEVDIEAIGNSIKSNPLRQSYEQEVRDLSSQVDKLRAGNMSDETIARTLYQTRRDLGVKYKDLTPEELRNYIYEVNTNRYGDPLGPSFESLVEKYNGDYSKIIEKAASPNEDVDKLLEGFKKWLEN
ncbi:RHS repeat-associated core domain-containing protein [Paenibacillus alba]|uniref:RHS repeat-associated core domain-containing protein n=1 Tax=Paenibacillus alba TaxID=1197127 RepID=UPI0030846AD2